MTNHAMVIGGIVLAAAVAAGALGTSPDTALWAAMVALSAWALVRFLHWRREFRE